MNLTVINTLGSVQRPVKIWTSTDGSKAVVLPYGGRVLELLAPNSIKNFFWTHPIFDSLITADGFGQNEEWINSGGDRTWLAPEVDLFFPNFPELDPYVVPPEIDPGDYQISDDGGIIRLVSRVSLRLVRTRRRVDLFIDKHLAPALNPLQYVDSALSSELGYAGYTLRTRLAFANKEKKTGAVGLWNVLQLPHGGELLIPTLSKPPIQMFGKEIDAGDLCVTEHLIRYKMQAPGLQKFGIQAAAAVGRVGYMYSAESETRLVIRNFFVNPSGEYVDVPWAQPDQMGSVIQACNVHNKLGQYSELEYHAPAIGGIGGRCSYEDESQVWAFSGDKERILVAARILISPEV